MGYRLESDTVRKIALDLIRETSGYEIGWKDNPLSYLKVVMFNQGVIEMAEKVVDAIEELKRS